MREPSEGAAIRRVPVPGAKGEIEAFRANFTRFSYERHCHESYALGVIDRGAMRFWYGGAVRIASRGTVIAINPAEIHDGQTATPLGCRYRMIYVERATIESLMEDDVPEIEHVLALRGPTIEDAPLDRALRKLHSVLERAKDPHAVLAQEAFVFDGLVRLFSRYGERTLALPAGGVEKKRVSRAKEYLTAHLDSPVRLGELAAVVGLSPFHFLRTFKRTTGVPPHAYLNLMRLERAREMLRAGEPPAEVAAALGFSDQSHLSRRFKKAFGVTPGQYGRAGR